MTGEVVSDDAANGFIGPAVNIGYDFLSVLVLNFQGPVAMLHENAAAGLRRFFSNLAKLGQRWHFCTSSQVGERPLISETVPFGRGTGDRPVWPDGVGVQPAIGSVTRDSSTG